MIMMMSIVVVVLSLWRLWWLILWWWRIDDDDDDDDDDGDDPTGWRAARLHQTGRQPPNGWGIEKIYPSCIEVNIIALEMFLQPRIFFSFLYVGYRVETANRFMSLSSRPVTVPAVHRWSYKILKRYKNAKYTKSKYANTQIHRGDTRDGGGGGSVNNSGSTTPTRKRSSVTGQDRQVWWWSWRGEWGWGPL